MHPERDLTPPDSQEIDGDPLRLPAALLADDPRYRIRPMQQVISALVGGLITTFVVTPMEVVKTRVQTQAQTKARYRPVVSKLCYVFHNGLMTHVCKPNSTDCLTKSAAADATSMRPLRGAMDAFVKIICGNGVLGLWSGLSPTLISALPSTIIYFLTYEYLKHNFSSFYYFWYPVDRFTNNDSGKGKIIKTSTDLSVNLPSVVPMASGICARTVVVTAITPLEMIRIKMQSGYVTYKELWVVLRSLIKTHGMFVLWRGWPPTVMRDAPFSGTYWAAYESIKRACNVTEPTFWFSFMAGASSGALATFVTMPFDLITTHTQIELGQDVLFPDSKSADKGNTGTKPNPSPSMAKTSVFARIKAIYQKQGVRGLYVGVLPRMLRVVPACAIMISAFEYSKSFFFRYNLDLKHTDYRRTN
ncbi:PREDICTED: solute carrier family 25 member 40 [Drosophila arizonae]|uniref:Solute carrier family 25 member 40 n=1 Tax=Drosophila arizonae TaxID=7263 RepID=A0ABM1PY35_DROAR|nr:PREDICTED: solute carrier family 25 member 40 [Drosophila arizonae]XP_017872121.1 PREDICTED: solute carrier family 25 member 40 [Drosophila arizonae]